MNYRRDSQNNYPIYEKYEERIKKKKCQRNFKVLRKEFSKVFPKVSQISKEVPKVTTKFFNERISKEFAKGIF